MELILISYPDFFTEEAELINRLFQKYSFVFHLRKPYATDNEIIGLLKKIDSENYNRIVIHNHAEITKTYKLKGVHSSAYIRCAEALSTSFHNLEEIKEYEGKYQYAFLSPIFPSISKKRYEKQWNIDQMQKILNEKRKTRLIALGGIETSNMAWVRKMKFDGYAFLGSVWGEIESTSAVISRFSKIYEVHNKL